MSTLDRALNNDFLMISKSLVPYLKPDRQKSLAIFIKTFELMETIDLFSKEEFVRSMSRSHDEGWEKEFLRDVRTNLSDDRGYFIDAILKLTEAKDLLTPKNPYGDEMSSATDLSSPPPNSPPPTSPPPTSNGPGINPGEIIDKLTSVLEPNQVQLLKILSSFLK